MIHAQPRHGDIIAQPIGAGAAGKEKDYRQGSSLVQFKGKSLRIQLFHHLNSCRNALQNDREQETVARRKIYRDLGKMSQLTEVDKVMIMNNTYAS